MKEFRKISKTSFSDLFALRAHGLKQISKIITPYVQETPVVSLEASMNTKISIKLENLTPSGSFKLRGASYLLNHLSEQFPGKLPHIYAASTGNHGVALSFLARQMGLDLTVVMPSATPSHKRGRIADYGVQLLFHGNHLDDALVTAKNLAIENHGIFIDSIHPLLIMGHTSLGFELFHQAPPLDTLFFPIGVGSGMAAMVLARNLLAPATKLIGVVPELCPAWLASKRAFQPEFHPPKETVAVGLRTAKPNGELFQFIDKNLFDLISVSENEILEAQACIQSELNTDCEPTGAVGLAGIRQIEKKGLKMGHVATVICGGR